ncbi:PREDICTED: uncharacterized protein LOC104814159 [Tarenaya hassleriana]|uniref:uncharacterized protein LOC104814159 n=1 Tax=Tarenaya hassleriana TaxID=28532 RepID=UPI00053C8864|nr:PREDICTED: uncharacterized protein LOC104814159 [Tarenaya hassleriana]
MANSSASSAASRHHHHHHNLSINPSSQIFKDVQGSDNPVPLSPQWLLPKTGESKTGMGTGVCSPNWHLSNRDGEETLETLKTKDGFRPSMLEMESGRHDRWRDEERDALPSVRKDRWRNGDREFGDNRKDRWDNVGTKSFGDSRRGPSDRWTDSGNRDAGTDQRRESKWNLRWGPDDKETEIARNRWDESGKDGESLREKGISLPSGHGKEREGDRYRPWRPSQSRGRGEPLQNQSTPNKQVPAFSHNRGRGENAPTFSAGRGRLNTVGSFFSSASTQSHPPGVPSDKRESGYAEPSHLRYSRMKLLDVYRMEDIESYEKFPDDFIVVPSLTCEKPSEPLALCAPDSEEVIILKAIEKGEVVSSGAPQISNDGPTGRNPVDYSQSRRIRPVGSREDMSYAAEESKDGSADTSKTYPDKFRPEGFQEGNLTMRKAEEGSVMQENNNIQSISPRPPLSVGERSSRISHDWNDPSADVRMKNSDTAWAPPKGLLNNVMNLPHSKGESRWPISEEPILRKHPSSVLDREHEARKLLPSSVEALSLYYKDPQGHIQGPFSGSDIIGWFEAGYFGIDLPVRLASAPLDSPFSLLGDVMPHLRAKSGPPPGFADAKQSELVNAAGRPTFPGLGNVHPGVREADMMRNDPLYKHVSATEAENRFVESLMSGVLNSSAQGVQGYAGNNSVGFSLPVADAGNDAYLLAKKLALEQQRSLPGPYSFWSGRDAANVMPGSESISEPARQPAHSPSSNLPSMLQGVDRLTPAVNNPLSAWSHLPAQSGMGSHQNKVDLPLAQSFQTQAPLGIQPQRPQAQNSPLAGLLGQPIENNCAGILPLEMMLASGLPQDPQTLNLVQQQLLLQLNSQTLVSSQQQQQQQLLLLEKILLLKHQKQQEEQQQMLRQQQQLLSQVLSEQQRLGESSYGQLQPSFDALRFQQSRDMPQICQQMPLPSITTQDSSQNVATPELSPMHLQHQMFGLDNSRINQGTTIPDQIDDIHEKDLQSASGAYEKTVSDSLYLETPAFASGFEADPNVEEKSDESYQIALNTGSFGNQGESASVLAPEICETEVPKEHAKGVNVDADVQQEVAGNEVFEARKISEKKSKKQRASKQSSKQGKGTSKASLQETKQLVVESADASETKSKDQKSADSSVDKIDSQPIQSNTVPSTSLVSCSETDSQEGESCANESSIQDTQAQPGRAWKPAPGFKPKSLLEIQMEEQRRAQAEALVPKAPVSVSSVGLATPWAGIVANADPRIPKEAHVESDIPEASVVKSEKIPAQGKKSHLHDLLAEEGLEKSKEKQREAVEMISSNSFVQSTATHTDSLEDDNFIEAKETKRSRKKSAKAKNSCAKSAAPVPTVDPSITSSSIDKGKSSRVMQQEKEVLPAVPSGPSLGDFVFWKGEADVNNPPPAPAWSTDSKKFAKPASLRDILKEQEKTSSSKPLIPVPISQKSPPFQAASQSSGLSWSTSASSPPSKAVSSVKTHSQASPQTKYNGDDDLFWGPVDQSTQVSKQGDFPHLTGQKSRGTKTTPRKANADSSLNRQKSAVGVGSADRVLSSPIVPQSLPKGKKDAVIAHTEANDFRDWCRNECIRLLGSEDTSVLEFCLKLPRSEAETLLTENLGSVDRDRKFIDRFLNYKDFLPAEVLDMAFRSGSGSGLGSSQGENDSLASASENDGFSKAGGGKKKGKKGKKVSPSVLGFNVVSNRIMMGEIQTIDD